VAEGEASREPIAEGELMSATAVPFEDLRLKDDIWVLHAGGAPWASGIVTGLGPNRELTLNASLKFGTDDSCSFIVLDES